MAAQPAAMPVPRGMRRTRWPALAGLPPRVAWLTVAAVGVLAGVATFAALWRLVPQPHLAAPPAPSAGAITLGEQGAPWPVPGPVLRTAELWYDTAPAPGVWAELKVVLDYPYPAGPTRTVLLVSGSLMEDFRIRSTEPKLLAQPRRRPDGRYAFVFPAPIAESLNWYRVFLECRHPSPHPVSLGFMLDGASTWSESSPVAAQVYRTDRQQDPFMVVPEPVVSWVPGQAQTAFPVLVGYAVLVGTLAAAGCAAAFWAVRRV